MRNRKKLSPEERLAAVDSKAQSALSLFEQAAAELDDAASTAGAVVVETETEVVRLRTVRDDAYRQQSTYQSQAEKIREFTR